MSKIIIKSAKFLKDKAVISYKTERSNGKYSKRDEEFDDSPHPDLRKAYAQLNAHAALLAEFVDAPDRIGLIEAEQLEKFHVTGFSISGDDRDHVVLTGQKTLSSGKILTFNTPVCNLSDSSDKAYVFADELTSAIVKAIEEVKEYLKGKSADSVQGELDFEDGTTKVTHMQILPPEEKPLFEDGQVPVELADGRTIGITPEPLTEFYDPKRDQVEIAKQRSGGRKKKPQTAENPTGD